MSDQYRKSPRAKWLEYNEGVYFVTVCTLNKKHWFGEVSRGEMHLSPIGKIVDSELRAASEHHPHICVPQYVVMPNHFHAIVVVGTPPGQEQEHLRNVPSYKERLKSRIGVKRLPLLSTYVGSLKSAVSRKARLINHGFCWQKRYHDHAIRGCNDGNKIADYIETNPIRWEMDCFYGD